MNLPQVDDKVWSEIVSGTKQFDFHFLAVKFFLGSAQLCYMREPGLLPKLANDLYNLFERNLHLASVQEDIAQLRDTNTL